MICNFESISSRHIGQVLMDLWSLHAWHAIQWLQGRYKVSISLSKQILQDLIFSNLIFKCSTERLAFVTWLPKLRTTTAWFLFKVSICLACCLTMISLWTKLKCMLYVVIDENLSLQCVHGNKIRSYDSGFSNFAGCKILLCSLKTFLISKLKIAGRAKVHFASCFVE